MANSGAKALKKAKKRLKKARKAVKALSRSVRRKKGNGPKKGK